MDHLEKHLCVEFHFLCRNICSTFHVNFKSGDDSAYHIFLRRRTHERLSSHFFLHVHPLNHTISISVYQMTFLRLQIYIYIWCFMMSLDFSVWGCKFAYTQGPPFSPPQFLFMNLPESHFIPSNPHNYKKR